MNNNLLKPDGVKSNFTFQLLYQTVILVIPLIVSPYLTRTLGSNSLGIYTYTYTIAYYFVTFAMLGINRHGQRIIAQRSKDIIQLRTTFWSLYVVHFLVSIAALVLYFIYVFFICSSNVNVAFAQSIYVFSAALDITWLFYGLEKFRIVSIRNAIVRIIESICIFIFVKSPSDIMVYTLIVCTSVCIGQIVMMPQVIRAIPPIRFSKDDMREHLKPLLVLFTAAIAVALYTVFDKTLLGILSTKDNVAFYEYSDKIVKIPRTFICVIGTVLFPRACRYATEKNYDGLRRNADYCLIISSIIGFAFAFGLASVAELFTVIYYGESFVVCGKVIIAMCPIIIITGLGETIRQSYIYPLGKDSTMVKILTVNAIVNLTLSAILIPVFGIYGAVIGTIAAESIGVILEYLISRNYFKLRNILKDTIPYAVIGAIMYASVRLVAGYYDGSLAALLIQVLVGATIYVVLTLIYAFCFNKMLKDMIINLINSIIGKIKSKHH